MTFEAELLVPAHGLPIKGTERINRVLGDLAHVLKPWLLRLWNS
ncbi:MAG: hypothetical protein Ct9H90mP30_1740 [Actinomycetota bacterium]|nr:MAG: hypothetical protein Ct9H90mP30_1740 [Actinomycetota bacterium]